MDIVTIPWLADAAESVAVAASPMQRARGALDALLRQAEPGAGGEHSPPNAPLSIWHIWHGANAQGGQSKHEEGAACRRLWLELL